MPPLLAAVDDIKLLAESFFATGQYRRAYSVLKERKTLSAGLRFRYLAALCQVSRRVPSRLWSRSCRHSPRPSADPLAALLRPQSMCEEWQECIYTLEERHSAESVSPADAEVNDACVCVTIFVPPCSKVQRRLFAARLLTVCVLDPFDDRWRRRRSCS